MSGCCVAAGNSGGGGEAAAHSNIGAGVDIFKVGTSVELRRLQALARGAVANNDLTGGIEVIQKPGDVNTNLVRWRNFYKADHGTYSTTSTGTGIDLLNTTVDGPGGSEDWIFIWSSLLCVNNTANDAIVDLIVDGVIKDTFKTNWDTNSLPSAAAGRVIRVDTAGATTPLPIRVRLRSTTGSTVFGEDTTVFGLLYEDP